ncbi:MAG: NADH-quinone oxidoreductase subunit C [Alphaproteobacteria bacterium]|nr:NADH-quinone oxidoreductase subunit C [Alphaproteobacteria bacterium]MDD9919731.1 NADH-quinone oxidoreductase subunit C [Alphaproteobacteria bacterium]
MSYTSQHLQKHIQPDVLEEVVQHIKTSKSDCILQAEVIDSEMVVVARRADIVEMLYFLRDDAQCQFKILVDICGVDWLGREGREQERFDVVYHLLSVAKNLRLRVKVHVAEEESVPTATDVFSSANWYERECYDLLGIPFEGHPDLRRILTDYDFDGHPLRKDFPLTGKVEAYYDEKEERVAYKPLDMPQEFREFDKTSNWQGVSGNMVLAEEDNVFDEDEFKNT